MIMALCLSHVDMYLCYDMSILFTCLRHIRAAMEGEATYYFQQDLYYVADPLELAARNVSVLFHDPRSFNLCLMITSKSYLSFVDWDLP